jgi:hypothetical protein
MPDGTFGRPFKLPVAAEETGAPTTSFWGGAHLVRLYAEGHPGGSVTVTVSRFQNNGNVFCDVSLSGHTVDAQ